MSRPTNTTDGTTGPTPIAVITAALPKLADHPGYAAAHAGWKAAANDRDASALAARNACTAAGRTALQAVADRAAEAEKEAAARLETARQVAATAVQLRTLGVLAAVRGQQQMIGLGERLWALLYYRACEEAAAAGLVPDPTGPDAALGEAAVSALREKAEADYTAFAADLVTAHAWAFDGEAGAVAAVDLVTDAVTRTVRGWAAG